jgi:hypothetical protein
MNTLPSQTKTFLVKRMGTDVRVSHFITCLNTFGNFLRGRIALIQEQVMSKRAIPLMEALPL